MTPFQQFRVWARRAPGPERAAAGVAAALLVASTVWLIAPGNHPGQSTVATGSQSSPGSATGGSSSGATPMANGRTGTTLSTLPGGSGGGGSQIGSPVVANAAGAGSSGGSGGGTRGNAGTGASTGGGSPVVTGTGGQCVSPPGTDQGATATQVKVAIVLLNIVGPAANSTDGIETPAEQQASYQAVVNHINATGGVACRKLAPEYFTADPIDTSNLQQNCYDIIQTQPFFVIDFGAYYLYPQIASCFPQAHIGLYTSALLPDAQSEQYYPYLFSKESKEMLYRDTYFALAQRGFFSAASGFRKLGLVYADCIPGLEAEVVTDIEQAGVTSSAIDTFDVGCPTGYTPPSTLEQAILKFQQDGVTNATEVNDEGDFANFTSLAEQQHFHPRYGLPDDGLIPISTGTQHPDYQNLANALAVTPDRFGEQFTPSIAPNAATVACGAIMKAANLPTPDASPDGASGQICDNLWLFQAAIDHAPTLSRSALAAGLAAVGSVSYSFPYGPNNFQTNSYTGSKVTYGGEAWRVDQFHTSCNCYQVIQAAFANPFTNP